MTVLVLDPDEATRIREDRQRNGLDRWDEVWDGVYVMAPLANIEHQQFGSDLTAVLRMALGWDLEVCNGANVSDRDEDWTKNYRCPDVLVFLPGTTAIACDTHWVGGPDFAVEIISKNDHSHEKLEFYAKVNVRELLMIDRYPWSLELYRLREGVLELVATSSTEKPEVIPSEVIPVSFQILSGDRRPRVRVRHLASNNSWSV